MTGLTGTESIPTEGPDPWAGLGMDAETIEERIVSGIWQNVGRMLTGAKAQLEAENAELERRIEGPEEGLWKGVGEEEDSLDTQTGSVLPSAVAAVS